MRVTEPENHWPPRYRKTATFRLLPYTIWDLQRCQVIRSLIRSLILLYATSFFIKRPFSKNKKELPLVALFIQEKGRFISKGFSLPSGLGGERFQISDFRFFETCIVERCISLFRLFQII